MAERNAVKPRTCIGCDSEFRCTAKEIKTRYEICIGGLGRLVLPDCGLTPSVVEAVSGHE